MAAPPPVLVIVTTTIGIGEYGGGVDGNSAGDGVTRKLAGGATAVVVATLGGGLGAGGAVGALARGTSALALVVAGGAVGATVAVVVETGAGVVVGLDAPAAGGASWWPAAGEASTRRPSS